MVAKPTETGNLCTPTACTSKRQAKKARQPAHRVITEERRAYVREWKRRHRQTEAGKQYNRKSVKQNHWQLKIECLRAYGGDVPACACCGESELGFLTIDHVDTDGYKTRPKKIRFYLFLKKNGFPNDPPLQVLCWNCNCGRDKNGGICPHKKPMCWATFGRPKPTPSADKIAKSEPSLFAGVGA